MGSLAELVRYAGLSVVLSCVPFVGGCGSHAAVEWQEEVKLLDGRVIHITQKRRYDRGKMPREFWVIFKLPEFGNREMLWRENLRPQVLNVYEGRLYLVGVPKTRREYVQFGKPNPSYVGYRYETDQWQRIPFGEIPVPIYDSNLLIESEPPRDMKVATLSMKAAEMADSRLPIPYKRIDPQFVVSNY